MRAGLFGDIMVQWKAGSPSGEAPAGISPGSGKKKEKKKGAQATRIASLKYATTLKGT